MSTDDRSAEIRKRLSKARLGGPSPSPRPGTEPPASDPSARRPATGAFESRSPRPSRPTNSDQIRGELHTLLIDHIEKKGLTEADEDELARAVTEFTDAALTRPDLALNEDERRRLSRDLLQEALGTGPLAPLMADPAVTDILVNGPDAVFVERFGRLEKTRLRFRNDAHLLRIIQRIVAQVGRRIDEASPMVDARLPDGSRLNATIPPISIDGPTLSIRRFGRRLRRAELMNARMMSEGMELFLDAAVKARRNVLIAGGTGTGKSTFLSALAESIPNNERIVTIEDAAELSLQQEHVVRMETRPPNVEGRGEITTRQLVINSLRMRPDRIIIGEVRGGEALDMLQAMNTGHDGSMTTIHANSPRDALSRVETAVLLAGVDLPSRAIREQIVSALQIIVHLRRYEDGVRRVESIAEVLDLEGETPQIQEIFRFERSGRAGRRVEGQFQAQGVVPRCLREIKARGIPLTAKLFQGGGPAPSRRIGGA
ncbi:MAG: CpaF family protein [Sumerlaeia bacterium]